MKYVQICATSGGWADAVVFRKHRELMANGDESYVFWGWGKPTVDNHQIHLVHFPERHIAALQARLDGKYGFHNRRTTRRLLAMLEEIQPDVIHLHSLQDFYIDVRALFEWLAKSDCQVLWTQHDCWAFTGYCMHYIGTGCEQWKTRCTDDCPARMPEKWPGLRIKSKVGWCYEQKRRAFTSLPAERMTLIAPSQWMADETRKGFLAKYPVRIVRNEVDPSVFRPTPSDYRERHGVGGRFMVLCVAGMWGESKGYHDVLRLAGELGDRFAVVVVGLLPRQLKALPTDTEATFVGIGHTGSREELAGLYTTADVLFNPTREDNYPTVNLEAEACGTPVITYDVGGAAETLRREDSEAVSGYEEALESIRRREAEGGHGVWEEAE